jgi:hypothetical protein
MDTPPDLVERYIFEPVAEINITHVFAFGAPWFSVSEKLTSVKKLKAIRHRHRLLGDSDTSDWTIGVYELPSKQLLVVSSQLGHAGPPGESRMAAFRKAVGVASASARNPTLGSRANWPESTQRGHWSRAIERQGST